MNVIMLGRLCITAYLKNSVPGKSGDHLPLGLTATPWRSDEAGPRDYFGEPRVNIDTIMGLKHGFLANVDYRMYTDNINWEFVAGY